MTISVANVAQAYVTRIAALDQETQFESIRIAAKADPVFKEHQSPLNQALKGLGRDYYKDIIKKGRLLVNKVKKSAKANQADFGYLMTTLLEGRESWPIQGRLALGLDVFVDLMIRSKKIPRYKVNIPKGDRGDENVDRAIRRLAQWVETSLTKELRDDLYDNAQKNAKDLLKKVKIDLSKAEMAQYLMLEFAKKLRRGAIVVQNSSPLRRIVRLLTRK